MKEKKNQTKLFDQVDLKAKRSTFDLSFPNKMTLNFNKIIPTLCKPTLPGDSWHINTTVFSRWLSMSAPVFSEYSLKFNSAFVANNMIYGGWQQFAGEGDDQAAGYLLPGQRSQQVLPNFTTEKISEMFYGKIFHDGDNFQICIAPLARKFFRLFALPLLVLDGKTETQYREQGNDDDMACLDYSTIKQINTLAVGSTLDNEYWDDMVAKGYAFELTKELSSDELVSYKAFVVNSGGVVTHDWCFYCHGASLAPVNEYMTAPLPALIELPKHTFFPQYGVDLFVDTNNGYIHKASHTETEVRDHVCTRWFLSTYRLTANTPGNLPAYLTAGAPSNGYIPYGYVYSLLPSELYTNSSVYTLVSFMEMFHRTFGQHIILQLFGRGSLTDYIGKAYSQTLLRQPFDVANKILGYQNTLEWNANNFGHSSPDMVQKDGTYNENSDKWETGVVNNVQVVILPYLAYHKIWSDYIRDNRYELRCVYADPYRSPFMLPIQRTSNANNGLFFQGDLFPYSDVVWDDSYGYYSAQMDFLNEDYDEKDDYKLTPEKPVSLTSFIMLVSLRERRVVHDFFTMITPTQQYDSPAVASVVGNEVTTLQLRLATRLQKFLERSNFVGSDFIKQTLAHFGVKPEHCNHCSVKYLGGKVMKPTISPVTITSANNSESGQVTGQQSAQMYLSGNVGKTSFSCNEHGYVFQLVTIQNDFFTTDGQSKDPLQYFDYPLPEFADLGPEALPLMRVVQTDGTPNKLGTQSSPYSVFGYVPRYAEWKCSLAEIHGDFRSSLSYWVSKRQFDSSLFHGSFGTGKVGNIPQVGKAFLYENPDYNAFDYTGDEFHHALLDIDHRITCSRLLPMLPNPQVL